MKFLFSSMIGIVGIVSVACSTPSLFLPEAIRDAAPLQFGVLVAKPDVFKGRVVQLAGRIVGIERSADGILIRAQELPMARDHVSGPAEIVKGTPQFAIMYPGKVDEKALWLANKLVVIGLAQGSQAIQADVLRAQHPMSLRVACTSGKLGPMPLTIILISPTAITLWSIRPIAQIEE